MQRFLIVVVAAVASLGCLYQGEAKSFDATEHRPDVEMLAVPVVLQEDRLDCGPAALSSLLAYWGIEETPDSIRRAIGTPKGRTLRAADLREHAKRKGLDAFVFQGTLAELEAEIQARRPVLVGTLKPYVGNKWFAHYEVVTAVGQGTIVTMDPGGGYREYPTAGFLREWERTQRVMLVAAKPEAEQPVATTRE